MKQPCPSTQKYTYDPQDEEMPEALICPQCDSLTPINHMCQVPLDGCPLHYRWSCVDCYDEVCYEEGYTPE